MALSLSLAGDVQPTGSCVRESPASVASQPIQEAIRAHGRYRDIVANAKEPFGADR